MTEVDADGVEVADDPVCSRARAPSNNVCAEATPSFDPAEQLADLERDGVYGAVLISRIHAFDPSTPLDVDVAYCQVVNDWLAETWGPHLDRAAPGFVLPYRDVAASVKEFERAAGDGLAAGAPARSGPRPPVPPRRVGAAVGDRRRLEGALHDARRQFGDT